MNSYVVRVWLRDISFINIDMLLQRRANKCQSLCYLLAISRHDWIMQSWLNHAITVVSHQHGCQSLVLSALVNIYNNNINIAPRLPPSIMHNASVTWHTNTTITRATVFLRQILQILWRNYSQIPYILWPVGIVALTDNTSKYKEFIIFCNTKTHYIFKVIQGHWLWHQSKTRTSSIVTLVLSCPISEILQVSREKRPHPYSTRILGVFPLD